MSKFICFISKLTATNNFLFSLLIDRAIADVYMFDFQKGSDQFNEWKKEMAKYAEEKRDADRNIETAIAAKKTPANEDHVKSAEAKQKLEKMKTTKPPKHDIMKYIDSIYTFVLLVVAVDYSKM